jgi:preprotein translocase subunit SecG
MAEQRYEREINELLQRLDGEEPKPLRFRKRRRAPWSAAWAHLASVLAVQSLVERLMALAVVFLLAAIALGFMAPVLVRVTILLAVACFIGALALSVWSGAQARDSSRYQPERLHHSQGSAIDWGRVTWRVRSWLARFRR